MSKILYINYYRDANPERQAELDKCLELNIKNPQIDKILLLIDNKAHYEFADRYLESDKIFIMRIGARPTYQDFFNTANKFSRPDDIHIIANTDIFFNETLALIDSVDMDGNCIALTRYDVLNMETGGVQFHGNTGSQDVWIFKGAIKPVETANFNLGKRGCDNRIAYLLEKAGYKIYNPCRDLISFHLHISGIRNYSFKGTEDLIPGPYKYIGFSSMEQLPKTVPGHLKADLFAESKGGVSMVKRKVLHIALNAGGKRQEALCKALESIGEYQEIDWMAIRDRHGIPFLRNHILNIKEQFNPDLIFMQMQTANIIDAVVADQLREDGCIVVNWTGDVRQPIPKWYYDLGNHVTITCFSNEADVNEFKKAGLPAEFLNIGFDETVYCPDGPIQAAPSIVFLGSHYGMDAFPLSRMRHEMVHKLREKYGSEFGCFGNGWEFPSKMLNQQEEAELYRSCKIAINVSHFELERYYSDRIFRIMGSGAFCLSHRCLGIEKDFLIGSELDTFNNYFELFYKIDQYLMHNSERRTAIAASGCELVHRAHTWKKRIDQLLTIIHEHRTINTRILA
jgi:hypothetical protein